MSGTSLDGLDLCAVTFKNNFSSFEIIASNTLPYNTYWHDKLDDAYNYSKKELSKLHLEYGQYLGQQALHFIQEELVEHVAYIASHGHTVYHQPENNYTLQIGSGVEISKLTQLPVIYDFRTQDIRLGGQGAPLVPVGDALLFSDYDACLNLGGFANISFDRGGKRQAFDICPVNIVLNRLAKTMGYEYDHKGTIAQKGKVNSSVFKDLNLLAYYSLKPPKSLGREFIENEFWPIILKSNTTTTDQLSTCCEHIGSQIGGVLREKKITSVLVSGGGAYNSFLLKCIQKYCDTSLIIGEDSLVNFKEALIFALLGGLRLHNKDNIWASVTGASKNHSSGQMVFP